MYFDSRRSTVLAKHGMVATSQPLAAVAGMRVLMQGGNAVDAAIASAAVLNVVEPVSTGVGGDMFALVWNNREKSVRAINGSGRSPMGQTIDSLEAEGHRTHASERGPFGHGPWSGTRLGNPAGRVRHYVLVHAVGTRDQIR